MPRSQDLAIFVWIMTTMMTMTTANCDKPITLSLDVHWVILSEASLQSCPIDLFWWSRRSWRRCSALALCLNTWQQNLTVWLIRVYLYDGLTFWPWHGSVLLMSPQSFWWPIQIILYKYYILVYWSFPHGINGACTYTGVHTHTMHAMHAWGLGGWLQFQAGS